MDKKVVADRSEWGQNKIIIIDHPDTEVSIQIDGYSDSVKMVDTTGGYYYFRTMREVEVLRDILNALIEENPVIRSR